MEDLVTAGVKGIMVSAVDPKTSTEGLNKIASETALFTTDSDAPQTKRIAYIGSSNVLAGGQAAEIAKKAMPDGGKCMGFVGLPGADNAKERIQGFNDGLKGTKISLVDVRGDDIDQARAKKNVEDALVANPDVTCMVGFYSYNTPRIYEALRDAGKLGKITVIGFDDDPITLGGVKEGTIAATVVQQPFEWAYQGFKLMAAYLKGDKSGIPANGLIIIPTKIIGQGRRRRLRGRSEGDVGQVRQTRNPEPAASFAYGRRYASRDFAVGRCAVPIAAADIVIVERSKYAQPRRRKPSSRPESRS